MVIVSEVVICKVIISNVVASILTCRLLDKNLTFERNGGVSSLVGTFPCSQKHSSLFDRFWRKKKRFYNIVTRRPLVLVIKPVHRLFVEFLLSWSKLGNKLSLLRDSSDEAKHKKNIMTSSSTKLSTMALSIMTFSIMAFSIMASSIMAFSIMALSIMS